MRKIFSNVKNNLLGKFSVNHARKHQQRAHGDSSPHATARAERQLLVDVSVIIHNDGRTGIQRVVRALLQQLLQNPPTGWRVLPVFATRQHGYCYAPQHYGLSDAPASSLHAAGAVRVGPGDIFLGLDLAAHLLPRHQTQLAQWKHAGAAIHVIVYDLLPVLHPHWFNAKTTRNFHRWLRTIAIFADSLICISNTVKDELEGWLQQQYDLPRGAIPIATIPLGADIDASAPSRGVPDNIGHLLTAFANKPTVLMVGTLEPRKGHSQVLAAFEQLWQQGGEINLVFVGKSGWKTEKLQHHLRTHPQNNQSLYWLDNASDEFLELLYGVCTGVIVASQAEGFGLPLIEAKYHNKPVLARDIPVLREIAGGDTIFFPKVTTIAELAVVVEDWLKALNSGFLGQTVSQGCATWEDSSAHLLKNIFFKQSPIDQLQCVSKTGLVHMPRSTAQNDSKVRAPTLGDMLRLQMSPALPRVQITPVANDSAFDTEAATLTVDAANSPSKELQADVLPITPKQETAVDMPQHGWDLLGLLTLDGEEFIRQAYIHVLGRVPDREGLSYYAERLSNGFSRLHILGQLAASGETHSARKLYPRLRWTYLISKYRFVPVLGVCAEIACSFSRAHMRELFCRDDEQFIEQAFQAVLGRIADAQGFAHYLKQLRSGKNRLEILVDMRFSKEGKAAGSRVAGLTALSWLLRLRSFPVVKQAVDVLTLPWAVMNTLQRIRSIDSVLQQQDKQHQTDVKALNREVNRVASDLQVAKSEILLQALAGETRQVQLSEKLDSNTTYTNALVRELHEATGRLNTLLAKAVEEAKIELLMQLAAKLDSNTAYTNSLVSQVQVAATQLNTSLPKAVEDTKIEILARLILGERSQLQIRQQVDQHAVSTASLINKESAAVFNEVRTLASDMQSAQAEILARVLAGVDLHVLLSEKLDSNTAYTNTLVSKVQEAAAQLNTTLPKTVEQAKAEILAQVLAGKTLQTQLAEKLDSNTAYTNTLVSKVQEAAAQLNTTLPKTVEQAKAEILAQVLAGKTLQTQLAEKLDSNTAYTNTLVSKVQEAAAQLNTTLPKTVEQAKAEILAQVLAGKTLQTQLAEKLDSNTAYTNTLVSKVQEAAAQLNTTLPKTVEQAKAEILAQVLAGKTLQTQLAEKLDSNTAYTNTLVSKVQEAAAQLNTTLPKTVEQAKAEILAQVLAGKTLQTQLAEKLDSNTAYTNTLVSKVQEAAAQLNTTLPKTVEQAKAEILAQVLAGKTLQTQLAEKLDSNTAYTNTLVSKVQEAAAQLNTTLPKTVEQAKAEILAQVLAGKTLQTQLAEKLDSNTAYTNTLVSKVQEAAAQLNTTLPKTVEQAKAEILAQVLAGKTLQTQLAEKLDSNTVYTNSLVNQVQEAATQLSTLLPKTVEEAKAEILAQVMAGMTLQTQLAEKLDSNTVYTNSLVNQNAENVQAQLRIQLNQLVPQLDRMELYGLTAARRVALPCGPDEVLLRTTVGYVLCSSRDHALIAALVESGELEPGTRNLIQRVLQSGDTFVDVGANVGMHTLAAAKAVGGAGRVIAIEPYATTAELLKKTIWLNGFGNIVEVHQVAASDEEGERTLYLGGTSGHHSLFPLGEASAGDGQVKVQVATVDQITSQMTAATLIKIDAEGAELEVMAGAVALLMRSSDVGVIAEFGSSHLKRTGVTTIEWLSHFNKLGFECQAIHPVTGELADVTAEEMEQMGSVNLFFARPRSSLWLKARGAE